MVGKIYNESGQVLCEEEVGKRWKEYCITFTGEGLCTTSKHRMSASVDEVPTDEVRSN